MSVDFNDANKAWAEKIGLSYPLLSDVRRQTARAYNVLFDDAAMANDPAKIPVYLRSKRSWFVIDTTGVVRYAKTTESRELIPNDELLEVLKQLQK
jgi:peroxiredoxin